MPEPTKFRYRFLADEDLHGDIIQFLKGEGHNVAPIPKGMKNESVFRLAKGSRRVLLTGDSDFMDSSHFPASSTKGIVVIRIHPQKPSSVIPVLDLLLKLSPKRINGRLVLLEPMGIRFP